MDIFSIDDFKVLAEKKDNPCVSILMPTHRTDAERNRIRFKNMCREAEKMLVSMGTVHSDPDEWLEPATGLIEDHNFWQYQSDGLALFLSDGLFKTYRLPVAFEEVAVVTDRFHIKPLIPLITIDAQFYVLSLSQRCVRLFRCTRQTIQEVEQGGSMPKALSEALRYDDREKQLQFHTGAGGTAVFHGHGVGIDDAKDRIRRYFREIDKGLHHVMRDQSSPLVLTGVDYLFPIYRETNSYPYLLDQGIPGNPDEMEEKDLHDRAWDLIEPYIRKAQDEAAGRYQDLIGTGKTSKDLKEIVPAAIYGRVAVLFVKKGIQQWGRFDTESGRVVVRQTQTPGDEDLLDLAAVQALMKGGEVYVADQDDLPDVAPATALFRY